MTRSFDVFDRDDFRNPDDLDRGASGGSESFWSVRIGKGELRNRRNHEIRHIKASLLALDYILAHPEDDHFETAEAKWRYLVKTVNASEGIFGPETDEPELITFPDRFPVSLLRSEAESTPVVR
jgi:hypothetical protein